MSRKLAALCLALLLAAPAVASAQNLVDPPEGRHPSGDNSGSIFNLFSAFKSRGESASDSGDHGCEPIINPAGNAVRRPGCP